MEPTKQVQRQRSSGLERHRRLAMRDEVATWTSVDQVSMVAELEKLASYPEREIRQLMGRICMPFDIPLRDYLPFFEFVHQTLFDVRTG